MADYISREAAIVAITKRECYNCGAFPKNCEICRTNSHKKAILSVPAADVVEVVRCGDCVHAEKSRNPKFDLLCESGVGFVATDFFCGLGRRRPDGDQIRT